MFKYLIGDSRQGISPKKFSKLLTGVFYVVYLPKTITMLWDFFKDFIACMFVL